MSKFQKIILFIISGLIGILVIIATTLHFFVDSNNFKLRLEAAASNALGMEVRVGGKLAISLFPVLQVTLEDLQIRNRGTAFISAKEAVFGIDLLPLLHNEVLLGKIKLKQPSIYIELGSDGKYNFETTQPAGPLPALVIGNVLLREGSLIYMDKQSGSRFDAEDCKLDLRNFLLFQGNSSDLIKNLSFTAELACAKIQTKDFAMSDLKFSIASKDGILVIKPVTMVVFGGKGSGSIRADYSVAVPKFLIDFALQQFRIEAFYKTLSHQKVVDGKMEFSAHLSMQGNSVSDLTQTIDGDASLRGDHLTLNGSNLDLEFARYESSQHFSLVDVGAIIFAGPVGLAVTKGYDFASILKDSGGTSAIRTIVSVWKIENGIAYAQDVAMSTNKNRIALKGGLDFVNGRFDDVAVTLLDTKGCAKVEQKISGPFQNPVVEQPNILVALAGPALKLIKKGRDILPGGECKVIYDGSVAPPL